jgi:hypothetical protein
VPELPGHMVVGRGASPGPNIGGYAFLPYGPVNVIAAQTDLFVGGFIAPCDMRLERISWGAASTVAHSSVTFVKNTSFAASGGTALVTAAIDLDASSGADLNDYAEIGTGGATTLVAAARNISKGDFVGAYVTTDGTGTLTTFQVCFVVFVTGHVNTNSVND